MKFDHRYFRQIQLREILENRGIDWAIRRYRWLSVIGRRSLSTSVGLSVHFYPSSLHCFWLPCVSFFFPFCVPVWSLFRSIREEFWRKLMQNWTRLSFSLVACLLNHRICFWDPPFIPLFDRARSPAIKFDIVLLTFLVELNF